MKIRKSCAIYIWLYTVQVKAILKKILASLISAVRPWFFAWLPYSLSSISRKIFTFFTCSVRKIQGETFCQGCKRLHQPKRIFKNVLIKPVQPWFFAWLPHGPSSISRKKNKFFSFHVTKIQGETYFQDCTKNQHVYQLDFLQYGPEFLQGCQLAWLRLKDVKTIRISLKSEASKRLNGPFDYVLP